MPQSRLAASAIVLAGGLGSRTGGNKFFLRLGGVPLFMGLLARLALIFDEIVVSTSAGDSQQAEKFIHPLAEWQNVAVCSDRAAGRGPLEGLRMGLACMRNDWGFLIGVDMLQPDERVIGRLHAETAAVADVVAALRGGRPMSLHAFYNRRCLPAIDSVLAQGPVSARGGPRIIAFYDSVRVVFVEEEALIASAGSNALASFSGFNTDQELQDLLKDRM